MDDMDDKTIFLPMIALVAWTFLVLLQVPYRRFRAAFNRQVVRDDFKFGESTNVPQHVSISNRNYMNLLEAPVLFYVACLTLYVTKTIDSSFLALAWAYVALRVLHSLVHLTYNHVMHRLTFFAIGNVVLITLWTRLALALLK
jgi:hypothetical protein